MGGAQYQVKCIIEQLSNTPAYEIEYFAHAIAPDYVPSSYKIRPIPGKTSRLGRAAHSVNLYKLLSAFKPDLIYQRVACAYSGVAALYAKRNGAKMIWHVAHDGDVSPIKITYGRNPIRQYLEAASVRYAIRNAHAIVTQTNHQATLLAKHYGRIADAIMPNFHPLPNENCDKSGTTKVVWIANFKRWKNPEAFIALSESFRNWDNVEFIMAGGAPKGSAEKAWFEALQRRIDDNDNLSYIGQKSQEEINELLASSHIFVNTSYQEGFANTFIQAWLRHVPVLSLYVNPDAILDTEEIGFCAGSESNCANLLEQLLRDQNLRERIGQKAAKYARETHSFNNVNILRRLFDT